MPDFDLSFEREQKCVVFKKDDFLDFKNSQRLLLLAIMHLTIALVIFIVVIAPIEIRFLHYFFNFTLKSIILSAQHIKG